MKRFLIATGIAFVTVASVAGAVDARTPANRGCYGESISALASDQAVPGGFGAAVVGFAQAPDERPGLGDGVQLLQAGDVGDEVVVNSCND